MMISDDNFEGDDVDCDDGDDDDYVNSDLTYFIIRSTWSTSAFDISHTPPV